MRVGDSSRCSEEIVKKNRIALFNAIIIVIIILPPTVIYILNSTSCSYSEVKRAETFLVTMSVDICLLVGWLLNVPATGECISGTDPLRQLYVLPH